MLRDTCHGSGFSCLTVLDSSKNGDGAIFNEDCKGLYANNAGMKLASPGARRNSICIVDGNRKLDYSSDYTDYDDHGKIKPVVCLKSGVRWDFVD